MGFFCLFVLFCFAFLLLFFCFFVNNVCFYCDFNSRDIPKNNFSKCTIARKMVDAIYVYMLIWNVLGWHIPTAITSNVLRDEQNCLTLTQNSTNWFPFTNYYRAGTKLYNTNLSRNRSEHADYLCLAECIKKYVIC